MHTVGRSWTALSSQPTQANQPHSHAPVQAIHIAAHRGIMGPPGAFATRTLLSIFCSFIALAVVSINAYFLVLFRQEHLPAGAGAGAGGPLAGRMWCVVGWL